MGRRMDNLATDPLFNIGMGLLSQGPSRYKINPWQGVQRGLMNAQNAQRYLEQEKRSQEQAKRAQQKAAMQQRIKEQELYQLHVQNAQRAAKSERDSMYFQGIEDPRQRQIAHAMGADDHATAAQTAYAAGQETDWYYTEQGPVQMTKAEGRAKGMMPVDVQEQSDKANRERKKEEREVETHGERNQPEPLSEYQTRKLAMDETAATRAQNKYTAELAATEKQNAANVEDAMGDADVVYSKVREALDGPVDEAGFGAEFWAWFGGTDERTLQTILTTIKSKVALSTLIELKKSGGTLGAVSKAELDLLESNIASLDVGLDPKILRRNLEQIDATYAKIYAELGGAPRKGEAGYKSPAEGEIPTVRTGGAYAELPAGAKYKDSSGKVFVKGQ